MSSNPYMREQIEAIKAVRQAARLCQAVRRGVDPQVLDKKDKSPVTVADYGSQAIVCKSLAAVFGNDPIIAEEDARALGLPENEAILRQVVDQVHALETFGTPSADEVREWIDRGGESLYRDRFWTIDPIDGTKGFLRNEQYAVALALVVEGKVRVGVLACPNLSLRVNPDAGEAGPTGVIFAAGQGQGAVVLPLDEEGPSSSEGPRPIRVHDEADPGKARFCESVESGHSAHGDAAAIAAKLGITAPPLRMDSQAKYGVVARGEAQIYLRMPTRADYREKIWDHAAGVRVVEEAGGTVTDITGRPLEFHHGRELIANRGVVVTNGRIHSQVLDALHSLGLAD